MIPVKKEGHLLLIGDDPQLIVNLKTQNNYIKYEEQQIPYLHEISFGDDLLAGKRTNVFETAVNYYYQQACSFIENLKIAEQYRAFVNTTIREF